MLSPYSLFQSSLPILFILSCFLTYNLLFFKTIFFLFLMPWNGHIFNNSFLLLFQIPYVLKKISLCCCPLKSALYTIAVTSEFMWSFYCNQAISFLLMVFFPFWWNRRCIPTHSLHTLYLKMDFFYITNATLQVI